MSTHELLYALAVVLAAGAVTVLLRALPFIAFSRSRETPPLIRYLGGVISPAAIAMLTVYCLCVHLQTPTALRGGAELAGCAVVAGLHLWKRNPLLSILAGTGVYMALVQLF